MFNNISTETIENYLRKCPSNTMEEVFTAYDIDYSSYTAMQRIEIFEAIISKHYPPIQQIIHPYHFLQDTLYCRMIEFPAGMILTSRVHTQQHLGAMLKGRAMVLTNYEELHDVQAPNIYVCSPGTKRLIITLEDCVWMTVHKLSPAQYAMGLEDINQIELLVTTNNDFSWASNLINQQDTQFKIVTGELL